MRKNRSTRSRGRACERRRRKLERIEFQAAGDRHARRIGAERDEAPRRFLALHAEAIDVGEDPLEERPDQPVARIRPRRDASVDEDRLHAARAAHAQQVRPDLGLHHDEDARPHEVQRAPDDEGPVEREVEHAVQVLDVPRHLLPRDRRRREKEAQARIAALEVGGERARGQRFADRHRVDPDGLFAIDVEGERKKSQTLAQAADVLLVANRLVQKVRRHQNEDDERQQAIGEIHLWARLGTARRQSGVKTVSCKALRAGVKYSRAV